MPLKDSAKPWEAIDIFLFSNGQQYSPPRKYHLRNEELEWWDATLNYLGRAHYGSSHSTIDVYTISGNKVQTPMELSNGAAYVAVVPPDAFISAGYEKYLVKASRSWEKSLQKRAAESLQTSKADVEQLVEQVINGKHQMETTQPHASSPENLTASPQNRKRSSSGGRSSFFSRRISSNSKPPETKKKPSNIPTPQATQNKNNSNTKTSTDPKRSSFKRKESNDKNAKQIISAMPKPIKNGTITTVSEVITSSCITTKDLQIQNNENETTNKKVTDADKEVMFYRNPEKDELSSHFELNVIDQVPVTDEDAELNKTISQTHLIKISEESLKTEDVLKNIIKHVVERVFTFRSKTDLEKTPNQTVNKEYMLDVFDTTLCPPSCNRNIDSDKSTEKIVTIIKNGDTINLKVNIEVVNTEAGKIPAGNSNFNKPETSLHVKRETESGIKVDKQFYESPTLKIKHNQELCFGTKPSQIVVVQCACTYTDQPTAFNESHPDNNTSKHLGKNNTKYILVPEDVLKQYQCCSCAQKITGQPTEIGEQNKKPEETTVDQHQPLVCLSSIKITTSTTSTQTKTQTNTVSVHCNEPVVKVAEHKEVKLDEEIMLTRIQSATAPVVVANDPHFSAQTDSFIKHLDHHDIKRHCCIKPETEIDETKKIRKVKSKIEHKVEAPDERETIRHTDQSHVKPARNEPEYIITKTYFDPSHTRREYIVTKRDLLEDTTTTAKQKPSYIVKRQEDPDMLSKYGQKTEFIVLRKQQPKDSVDVSTQTDWCDTLLQTRINEDGHYSFHLPTLQLLREYKL